ncbi:MAG: type I secretion system permease/ATPase [Porticoccaceae bacterium]|nr:type I secretion system permease/ATPase [Porticoccaceae bacterium]
MDDSQLESTEHDIEEGGREELASLLSRLASLQGVAVPAHRFSYQHETESGVSLDDVSVVDQAVSLWGSRFPQGPVVYLDAGGLTKLDFPVLWVSSDGAVVKLLRGMQNGGFISESADWSVGSISEEEVADGVLVRFLVHQDQSLQAELATFSAKQWFIHATQKRRRIFFEAVFATFVLSIFGLMSALYTMQVYDRVVPTKGFSTLWVLTIGVLLAIFFELIMKLVRSHMVDRASKVIDQELSGVFFSKALAIRSDCRPKTVGTFAAQIRHFESVRNFMTSSTLFILADAPFALFFILVIYFIAGPVAYVPLIMIPVGLLIGLMMRGPIERFTAENMEESNKKNGLLIEAIDGIESVKAASAEWKLEDRWRELTRIITSTELKSKLLTAFSTSSTQSIQQLSYVGIIATGAYSIANGDLTMGGLIACSIISGRALTPLAQMPSLIVQWKHAKIALEVLDGIMALPSEREHQRLVVPDSCKGEVKLTKVAFAYEENAPSISIEKLAFKPGDRVAVLGAVGSGKSTLIKILSGLYRPQQGGAFLDDMDMSLLASEFVREQIGYLPQEVRLFNGTLRENLVLGLPVLSDSQILKAAALTGLDQAIQNHPSGLEINISEGGKGLSGGQRQLVGLTRLLLARPKILLLDEPTASMDSRLEEFVMQHLFEELPADSVIVLATHKAGVLKHVNRIVVMDSGKVTLDGPKQEVLDYLSEQAKKRAGK